MRMKVTNAWGNWVKDIQSEVLAMTVPLISTCRITIVLNIQEDNAINNGRRPCGFHLTRSKWDPYPWIGYVEQGSIADVAGLKAGDCLLQIDQFDVVGLRIKDIASLIKIEPGIKINLQVWRSNIETVGKNEDTENNSNDGVALSGPLPILIRKFLKAISLIVGSLECPVCLETTASPTSQCVHGHILCSGCRRKALRCPICRVRLGQGRCLVADEVHRNIREAFEDNENFENSEIRSNLSLKQKLFGKVSMKSCNQFDEQASSRSSDSDGSLHYNNNTRKSKIALVTRLLRGHGFDRAMSAENLSSFKKMNSTKSPRIGELAQSDRTKSASTGELSRNDEENVINQNDEAHHKLGQYLSVPPTPTWGGSTESLSNSIICPLSITSNCREPLTRERLGEHLHCVHNCETQMHFYGRKNNVPISLDFDTNCIYIFHYVDELFIFQHHDEAAWMIGTNSNNMEWILSTLKNDKTELKLQKQVLKINDTVNHELPCYRARIPSILSIKYVHIELISSQSHNLL